MDMTKPHGAVVEIIEYSDQPNEHGVIVPNSVSINGQELLTSADHPVTVHEVQMPGNGAVLVTLTLFARRIVVEQRRASD